VITATETIRGIPQLVQKIKVENVPDAGIRGIEPAEIVHRIIVGPSDHASTIYEALSKELGSAGVSDATKRVVISWIPLRA
jgi:hypothetical protein